jgi:very-short-patch-repair endonuclease
MEEPSITEDRAAIESARSEDDEGVVVDDARVAAVRKAVREWTNQLIDLGGRNTLLHFRDLRVSTLDIADASEAARDTLVNGHTVSLAQLYPDAEVRAAQAKRCRAIQAKAKENLEERGLLTLFLGVGMATWTNDTTGGATPAAPLLLRPLTLVPRGGSAEDFDFVPGEDWEFNPTLAHKLKSDFAAELDPEALLDAGTDEQGRNDLDTMADLLRKQASEVPGFDVTQRWIVANLSYAKMPMVTDLENCVDALAEHPVICALAGSDGARDELRAAQGLAGEGIDLAYADRMEPADEFLILDADASQSQVINLAVAGAHLVAQGPPGTGKSQTIANLIATLVARGKSVLFVAEKRAAIDAVTSRLGGVGLSDLVLDLHEGTASRKRLAADLGRVLESMGRVPANDYSGIQRTLVARRSELNQHSAALHEPREPWGVSVYGLQTVLLGVPDEHRSTVRLFGPTLERLGADEFPIVADALAEWSNIGGVTIERRERPWAGAIDCVHTGDDVVALQQSVHQLKTNDVPALRNVIGVVATQLGQQPPATPTDCAALLALHHDASAVLENFEPDVFTTDLDQLIADLQPAAHAGSSATAALFNSRYRAAKRKARALTRGGDGKAAELLHELERARDVRHAWATRCIDGGLPRTSDAAAGATAALTAATSSLEHLAHWLGAAPLLDAPLDDVDATLDALIADFPTLQRLPRLAELRSSLRERGLGPVLDDIVQRQADADSALQTLTWVRARSLLDQISAADLTVSSFTSTRLNAIVDEFTDTDAAQIASGVPRVQRAVAEAALVARNEHPDQSSILTKNARLKRRHASVRDLMAQAPDVLLALRPCWVMSPLVVAQLLPGGRPLFDVVIFDEASQIRPADAISSLARGRQAIVAGDSKQLPPTTFFDVTSGSTDLEDAENDIESYTQDMDSILDAMSALLPPPHGSMTLDWHYRSRDERLIAFSNAQPDLYDWSLTTFPGIAGDGCLCHVHVPFRPGLPTATDSSSDEVAQVIELIREHAETHPDKSLGVIAMGIKHAERIQEALRLARRDDPDLDAAPCLDEGREHDPLFIKNLERVQGDERDAIILTIGYTKTTDGRMQYRFGPLNQEGGERRLNVAITRARERMTVVSSFTPEDMDDEKLRAEGARMLKRYLTFARSGGSELGNHAMSKPALNPFELDVRTRLTRAGIPLVAQYGVAGYWIDFAAKHPERPGEMVLAIEADGASYHSAPTARARDRLRQQHLESLGWHFHRIWSGDWFRDPETQVALALTAYDAAVKAADDRANGSSAVPSPKPAQHTNPYTNPPARGARPPLPKGLPITEYRNADLDALCRWIVSDTLLRTDEELLEAMMQELGYRRRGSRIVQRLNESIKRVRRTG